MNRCGIQVGLCGSVGAVRDVLSHLCAPDVRLGSPQAVLTLQENVCGSNHGNAHLDRWHQDISLEFTQPSASDSDIVVICCSANEEVLTRSRVHTLVDRVTHLVESTPSTIPLVLVLVHHSGNQLHKFRADSRSTSFLTSNPLAESRLSHTTTTSPGFGDVTKASASLNQPGNSHLDPGRSSMFAPSGAGMHSSARRWRHACPSLNGQLTAPSSLTPLMAVLDQLPRYYGAIEVSLDGDVDSNSSSQDIIEGLIARCMEIVKAPLHVIWDSAAKCLTVTGERALRRAFWMMDTDVDGLLNNDELLGWHNTMYGHTSQEDVDSVVQYLQSLEVAEGLTSSQRRDSSLQPSDNELPVQSQKDLDNIQQQQQPSSLDSPAETFGKAAPDPLTSSLKDSNDYPGQELPQQQEQQSSYLGGISPHGSDLYLHKGDLYTPKKGVTPAGFLAICDRLVSSGDAFSVWAVLWETGIGKEGLPYDPHRDVKPATDPRFYSQGLTDNRTGAEPHLSSCFEPAEQGAAVLGVAPLSLELSNIGIQFFESLFTLKRFVSLRDLWSFVPEAPWAVYPGMPHADAELDVTDFVQCWRGMANLNPLSVIIFACYWGYTGDTSLLLRPRFQQMGKEQKKKQRTPDDNIFQKRVTTGTTTARVLVLGSLGCGKSLLLRSLATWSSDAGFADTLAESSSLNAALPVVSLASTTTAFTGGSGGNSIQNDALVVYLELQDEQLDTVLNDTHLIRFQVDALLLCFDGSDEYSFNFVAQLYPVIASIRPDLPSILVMTKADRPLVEQLCSSSLLSSRASRAQSFHTSMKSKQHQSRSPPNKEGGGPAGFCARYGLIWPPLVTSCVPSTDDTTLFLSNDLAMLTPVVAKAIQPNSEFAFNRPHISIGRRVRRVLIIGLGVTIAVMVVRRTLRGRGS